MTGHNGIRRAVIYARYSSDLQSEVSIADQIRLCRERAEKDGYLIIETYSDFAISGGSLRNRPGIQALMSDAKTGKFDLVIAEALDRLSRDQEDIAAIYKRLAHAEVAIVTLAEGEVTELHVGLKGTMNALFLKDLAAKTKRGQRGRVEAGKIPGGNSYGYRIVKRITADGILATGERQIDPDQAAIVIRILNEFANGVSPRIIATRLNQAGIAGPRGGYWNASTINGSRRRANGILNNQLYIGRIVYNRQRFVKDPETGKRVSRLNPPDQWISVEVPELRIVDDPLWERVQALKGRYSSHQGNKRQTRKRLLSGLIKCGRCHGGMTIMRRDRYYCSARHERGTCDNSTGIGVQQLEDRVLGGLKDLMIGNEHLLAAFVKEFNAELQRLRKERHGRERGLHQELKRVNRGIKRCVDFIVNGSGNPASVGAELSALEHRKAELDAELRTSETGGVVEFHPNLPRLYRQKVEHLREALVDEETRPTATALIRSLIDRIEIVPGGKRGEAKVEIVGGLAMVLNFIRQKNTAASGSGGDGTFLMVAGAGFEPATFRL